VRASLSQRCTKDKAQEGKDEKKKDKNGMLEEGGQLKELPCSGPFSLIACHVQCNRELWGKKVAL